MQNQFNFSALFNRKPLDDKRVKKNTENNKQRAKKKEKKIKKKLQTRSKDINNKINGNSREDSEEYKKRKRKRKEDTKKIWRHQCKLTKQACHKLQHTIKRQNYHPPIGNKNLNRSTVKAMKAKQKLLIPLSTKKEKAAKPRTRASAKKQ